MIENILIPENELAATEDQVKARVRGSEQIFTVDLDNDKYGSAFNHFLLLSYWPELLGDDARLTGETLFYNRYYWFLKFIRLYTAEHGADAGLEQQAFQ